MSDFNIHNWQAQYLRPSLDESSSLNEQESPASHKLRKRTIKGALRQLSNLIDYSEWDLNAFLDLAIGRLDELRPKEVASEITEISSEEEDRMIGLTNIDLYNAIIKASRVIVNDLRNEGFDDEDIYEFLIKRIQSEKYINENKDQK